jgi:hypothetical protein
MRFFCVNGVHQIPQEGIIDATVYEGLKQQVIAKQPNKDAVKNAELYIKKK